MISENRRIAKNTILLYFRTIIVMFISLYTSRVVLQTLGIDNFGIYNVVGGMVSMFSIFSVGIVTATTRFISFELGRNDFNQLKKTVNSCITVLFIIGIIIIIAAELAGVWFLNYKMNIAHERMIAANWVFQCSLLTFFFNVINIPYNAIIVSHERMSAFAFIGILEASLKLIIVFLLHCFVLDRLVVYAILMLVCSLIIRLVYIIYCKKHFPEARQIRFSMDRELIKKIFAFAGWNIFGSGAIIIRNQGINILFNLFFGVAINAAKGIAQQVNSAVYAFVTNFQMAVKPQIIKNYAANNLYRVHFLIKQGGRFSFYLLLLLSMPLFLETDLVLKIWLGNIPHYSTIFVRITLISLLIESMTRFIIVAVQATGEIKKMQMFVGFTKILALPIAYIMLKFGATPVVGMSIIIITEIITYFIRLYFAKLQLNFDTTDFMKNVTAKVLFVSIIAFIFPFFAKFYVSTFLINKYLYLSIITIICLFSTSACIYILGMLRTEREFVVNKVTKLFRK